MSPEFYGSVGQAAPEGPPSTSAPHSSCPPRPVPLPTAAYPDDSSAIPLIPHPTPHHPHDGKHNATLRNACDFSSLPVLPEAESWLNDSSSTPFNAKAHNRNGFSAKLAHLRQSGIHLLHAHRSIVVFMGVSCFVLLLLGMFAFDPMSWKAWLALIILCATLALLVTSTMPIVVAMSLGLVTMLAFQIVTPEAAIAGFANTGVMTVAILFIVAEGVSRTSVLLPIFRVILGKPNSLWQALCRLLIPVSMCSAFLNDTPVVAMFIPLVQSWARRTGFSPSLLLMPMNNAALLGGTLTLLGTSTNLVIDGLAREAALFHDADGNVVGLPIFGVTPIGIACVLVGAMYMVVAAHFILPKHEQQTVANDMENPRKYGVAFQVTNKSSLIGDTVGEAGFFKLSDAVLLGMRRADGTEVPSVGENTKISGDDVFRFSGLLESVTQLYHFPGVVPATVQSKLLDAPRSDRRLIEVVIARGSPLVGNHVRGSRFRSRFSAIVIAVHRNGQAPPGDLSTVVLQEGDTLLLEGDERFCQRFERDSNFALVAEVIGSQPPREDLFHRVMAGVIALCMVGVAAAGWVSLMTSAAVASFLMVATGCLSLGNAARAVNVPVVVAVAASFGISNGMQQTGAATQVAKFMLSFFEPFGNVGVCTGVYVATAALSSVITNNAAVALMFPVILSILQNQPDRSMNAKYRILYTLMIAASASFSTPIAYQTNLMVHAAAGYKFMDWVKFGMPLLFCECIVGVLAVMMVYS